jgi:hypothetical protein
MPLDFKIPQRDKHAQSWDETRQEWVPS